MSCDYNITGHLNQDCVPTAPGYNSGFYIATWEAFSASVKASEITWQVSDDQMTRSLHIGESVTLKPLYQFADPRTAVFTGSTKAKADSPMSIPYFTKSLQLAVDKNATMGEEVGISATSKLLNILSAGRFVLIAERVDGMGFEAFGALSPLKCTAVDQSLASDDSNSGMVTVTLETTEGEFAIAVDGTATSIAKLVAAS